MEQDLDSQPSSTDMANPLKTRFYRNLVITFGIVTSIVVIMTIIIITSFKPQTGTSLHIEWYHELQPSEIRSVLKFLQKNISVRLVSPEQARLNASFVHYIELKLPAKENVRNHLYKNGTAPIRSAKAAIFRGDLHPPVVEEYHLWPLPNISFISKFRVVPYYQRPLLLIEMASIYMDIVPKFEEATKPFLKDEYNMTSPKGLKKFIDVSFTPIPSTVAKKERREVWIWFNYKTLYKLHPLDFQFEADITSVDPSNWTLGRIWFEGNLYDNTSTFMDYYLHGRRQKIPWYKRKQSVWYTINKSGQKKPFRARDSKSNTHKRRYKITDNFSTVTYLKWKFHLQISPTGGLRLLNIKYGRDMIVYEMNLQEVAVIYSGSSPAAQNLNFVDGTALFGSRIAGLVEGIDCPFGAAFISPTIYTVNDGGLKMQNNAACIFEHDPEVPLRRHKSSSSSEMYYNGLPDKVLVVRVILTFLSYDYIMDYVFHNNGAVEARVFSTGSLITTSLSHESDDYGLKIDQLTVANIHNHLFNYKVDLDIVGVSNRHSIWRLNPIKKANIWRNLNATRNYSLEKLTRDVISTEQDAAYIYDFQKPLYLLFHNNFTFNKNKYPRSYRIVLFGLSPKTADDEIFNSIAWAETQLAVTKRKESEETSSSVYALWDSSHPVVDFKRYVNNESIVDEDLVAWITLGFRHIPQMENIPCTLTLGTKSSFLLVPFNYFDEDPTTFSEDNVFFKVD